MKGRKISSSRAEVTNGKEVLAIYRIIMVFAALCSLLLILPIPASAAPLITSDYAFIDNRPSGDIIGFSGLNLNIGVTVTDSGGPGALTGASQTALSSNSSFPFTQPVNLGLNNVYPRIGGAEFTNLRPLTGTSQFPNVTGTYTFTVNNTSSQSTTEISHSLDKPEEIPLPTLLSFSDQSTTPVFTFTDPDNTPDITDLHRYYLMEILDNTKVSIYQSAILATPSFAVPPGILQVGDSYYFRAKSLDYDFTEVSAQIDSRLENRAIEYATFQPASVPEPVTVLLLGLGLIGLAGLRRKLR